MELVILFSPGSTSPVSAKLPALSAIMAKTASSSRRSPKPAYMGLPSTNTSTPVSRSALVTARVPFFLLNSIPCRTSVMGTSWMSPVMAAEGMIRATEVNSKLLVESSFSSRLCMSWRLRTMTSYGPRVITSPSLRIVLGVRFPFTKVPFEEPSSSITIILALIRTLIRAWTRETSLWGKTRSHWSLRPIVRIGLGPRGIGGSGSQQSHEMISVGA